MGTQFVAETNKLKNIQKNLENLEVLCNYVKKYGDNTRIQDFHLSTEKNRKFECETRQQEIKNIFSCLREKKELLAENLRDINVKQFRAQMVQTLDDIHKFLVKTKISLTVTEEKEKEIRDEVQFYNEKIKEWIEPIKYSNKGESKLRMRIISSVSLNKDVKNFMDFVSVSGGHENGWTESDHHLFLKIRGKNRDSKAIAISLQKLLPDLTVEDVEEHESWYKKYLELKQRKEKALEEWRRAKTRRVRTVKSILKVVSVRSRKDSIATPVKRKSIKEWKEQKETEKQQLEQLKQEELKKMKEKKMKQQKINAITKQRVAAWKEEQDLQKQADKLRQRIKELEDKKERTKTANELIKLYRSRDDYHLLKIKQQFKTQQQQQDKIPRSISCTYAAVASRDPNRILKPTKQWLQRTALQQTENKKTVCDIRNVPKLKIPEWIKKV